jgi:hypothetical protein
MELERDAEILEIPLRELLPDVSCWRCGTDLDEDGFCSLCGAVLTGEPDPVPAA